jgi:hypothetical protein
MRKSLLLLNYLTIITSTLALTSCGGGTQSTSNGSSFSVSSQMLATTNLDTTQRNIATRICYAYQSKNANFSTTDFLGTKFVFKMDYTACPVGTSTKGETSTKDITSTLKKSDTKFYFGISSNDSFNSVVQTNVHGYLSQLCTKINNNQTISNTTTYDGQTAQISFFTEDLDAFKINYFTKSGNTSTITAAEVFKVRTQPYYAAGSSLKILGMDDFYISYTICPDTKYASQMQQTLYSR